MPLFKDSSDNDGSEIKRSCVSSCDLGKWEKIKNINKLPPLENDDDNDDERKIKRSSPAPGKIKGTAATVVKRGQQAPVQRVNWRTQRIVIFVICDQ